MDSSSYKLFFLLHIAAIVVAFAPAVVAVLPGGDSSGTLRAYGRIVYAPALILAGLFGIVLILLSDEVWEFSQTWVSLAFLVWIAMVGVFQAIVLPGKRLGGGGGRRSSTAVDLQTGEAVLTVLFLVMLYLMIWKPGF
jgi:uncharacterized membrane protein